MYQISDCIKLIREAERVNRLKFVTLEQDTTHVLTTVLSLMGRSVLTGLTGQNRLCYGQDKDTTEKMAATDFRR